MSNLNWNKYPDTTPTVGVMFEWENSSSNDVLVLTKHGRLMMARYVIGEDGYIEWRTTCSEGWDITKGVIKWAYVDAPTVE